MNALRWSFLTLLLSASSVSALTPNPVCVRDARASRSDCNATCLDNFQVDKDSCLDVNHTCADACRTDRLNCRLQPVADLDACVSTSQTALDAATQICRNTTAANTPERNTCIDAAQVIAFQQRDACREIAHPLLKVCRLAFQACFIACPSN